MKAITITPGSKGARVADRPEPSISRPDEVKLRVLRVGICGTDREEVSGGRARAPDGQKELVIGHEMLGRALETGERVTRVRPGDYAVFSVRRGCGECLSCLMNRSDMCTTGRYRERGIWGQDGYQAQYAVDAEQYLTPVPEALAEFAVLCEPLSVVEKAIEESVRIQRGRLPDAGSTPDWLTGKRCLVAGLGPIGLLAALALRLRGAAVYGLDIVDAGSMRPKWLEHIGGAYIDGRSVKPDKVDDQVGAMDMILDATGIAKLEFDIVDALGKNGIYVLTGIPGGDRPVQVDAGALVRRLVLNNQIMYGSVNAAPGHFHFAVNDLHTAACRWGDHVGKLITGRVSPEGFEQAALRHRPEEIKTVVEWAE